MPGALRVQSTTGTTPFASAPTVGNRIYVACFNFSATIAPFDNASGGTNTYAQIGTDAVDANGNHVGWYYCDIARTNAALALGNAGGNGMHAIEITGFDTGSITDSGLIKTLQAATSSAISLVSGTVAVSRTGGLVLAAVIDQNTATWAVSAPDTQLANTTTHDRDISSYQENVASGNYTPTFTAGATASNTAAMAALSILAAQLQPIINTQPTDQQANIGGSATFTISATTSGGALSYQWKFNGSNVGTNSASYTRTGVAYADQRGAVTCDVTDSNGTTVSSAAKLLVTFAAAGTGPRRRNVLGATAVGTLGTLGAATGGPAYSATARGGGLAAATETTARTDTGTTRATGAAAATQTTARIAAATSTGTGRAAGIGAKSIAWAATATGGGASAGSGLHAGAQSGTVKAGGRASATEATARTGAAIATLASRVADTETTGRANAATIKAAGLVADAYSVAFIRATFGTATGGGRANASGLHAAALQGTARAGGKVTGAALHAVALGAIVRGIGTVATVGAKSAAWSVSVRGGGFADDSYLINHIDYGRAPVGGRAFMLRDTDTARPHEPETERAAVISGTRAGNINTARPANRGGRRT